MKYQHVPGYENACLSIHLFFACLSTAIAFYADEGNMNFDWIAHPGNWIMFIIYVAFFLLVQMAVQITLIRGLRGRPRALVSAMTGSAFLMLTLYIVFGY